MKWIFSFPGGWCKIFEEESIMISGGNATIYVADMDRSIHFYAHVLGLKLTNRFGNDWATVSAGEGLTIGIHPASAKYPNPGTKGSISLGLDIDIPVEKVMARLAQHGVAVKGSVTRSEAGNFASIEDPDGNDIYLWEKVPREAAVQEFAEASVA